MKKQFVSMAPANEMGRSEDVAKAASFLASNDSRYIRGIERRQRFGERVDNLCSARDRMFLRSV
jgi:NAD(P)-dependent dehydrogenase (short-subunit alcohol dehydrogenase family)